MNQQPEEAIRTWGPRDVALWLQEVGYGECAKDFRGKGINGKGLLGITTPNLSSFPSLTNRAKRDGLIAAIAQLPGSALGRAAASTRTSGGGRSRRIPSEPSEDDMSPPPLPERPDDHHPPEAHQYGQNQECQDDSDGEYDDDSFDDTDDENDNPPPLPPPTDAQRNETLRNIEAKFKAFGLVGNDGELTALERQYIDEYGDDGGDIYDEPPEPSASGYLNPYSQPPVEDDEDNIYDVPPEEAQGHFHATPHPVQQPVAAPVMPKFVPPQMKKAIGQNSAPGNQQSQPPSLSVGKSSVADQRKMFETKEQSPSTAVKATANSKPVSSAFKNKPASSEDAKIPLPPRGNPSDLNSSGSGIKLPPRGDRSSSPHLPPKPLGLSRNANKPPAVANNVNDDEPDNHGDGDGAGNMPANMPSHLRERFRKSKQDQRKRKESHDNITPIQDETNHVGTGGKKPEARSSGKVNNRVKEMRDKLDSPEPLPPAAESLSSSSGAQSVKDRMKAFSDANADKPPPLPVGNKPPASPKWVQKDLSSSQNSTGFSHQMVPSPKLAGGSKGLPKQLSPSSFPGNSSAPPLMKKNEPFSPPSTMAAPPLPSRDTKPSPSISRAMDRPPMPLPPAGAEIEEDTYDPPDVHLNRIPQEPTEDETYDPPQVHKRIEEEPPPPLPKQYPSPQLPSRFTPKSDRKASEPALPPRLPKSNETNSSNVPKSHIKDRRFTLPSRSPSKEKIEANSLTAQAWYCGDINRTATEAALAKEAVDGCFIVRDPSKPEEKRLGYYSLSLWHGGKTRHLRIRCRSDKKYVVGETKEDETAFNSVVDLVQHHRTTALMLKSGGSTKLTCMPSF